MSLHTGYTLPSRYKEQPVNVWGSQLTLRRVVHVMFRFKEQGAYSEANISSYTPVNRHDVRNTKVHQRIHKIPPIFLTLSHMRPTRTVPYCFSEIDFNIILPLTPGPSIVVAFSEASPPKLSKHFCSRLLTCDKP